MNTIRAFFDALCRLANDDPHTRVNAIAAGAALGMGTPAVFDAVDELQDWLLIEEVPIPKKDPNAELWIILTQSGAEEGLRRQARAAKL